MNSVTGLFMPEFRKPHHRLIARVLESLDGALLLRTHCYFGGGTRIALEFNEYRESRDIDFLCASREGFRELRETVSHQSLGKLVSKRLRLAREVRSDRDGIRTFFEVDSTIIKFEIVREVRIDLVGTIDRRLGVPALDAPYLMAEKLLANADRGGDASVHSRDLIDLAFMVASLGKRELRGGVAIAQEAYGTAVLRELRSCLTAFSASRTRAAADLSSLGVTDTPTLRKGLRVLRSVVRE
jgi:Nucleotidyl transferase AbiEii toxin, Type IV TA system